MEMKISTVNKNKQANRQIDQGEVNLQMKRARLALCAQRSGSNLSFWCSKKCLEKVFGVVKNA